MSRSNAASGESPKTPPAITSLSVSGFKSIVEEQTIEIRPLTLLAGANSSGKSSMMLPLLLLKQTLEAPYDPGPLLLNGPNVKFTSGRQLVSKVTNQDADAPFVLALETSNEARFATAFRWDARVSKIELIKNILVYRKESLALTPDTSIQDVLRFVKKEASPDLLKASQPYVRDAVERIGRNRFRRTLGYPADALIDASFSPQVYRLEDMFARHGEELTRATLCGWMAQCAELLTPLFNEMVRQVLLSLVIHTDDTPVPVWDPTLPHTRTGRFWVYVGDVRHPYVVYDYTPRRTRDGPEDFLKGFRGYLQADAFSGYDRICAGPGVVEVACWAHVRRKFYESRTSAPVPAHAALARIRQLYRIEHDAAELSVDDRRALRRKDALPRLNAFDEWLTEQGRKALPKNPINQAIAYARSNWAALLRYTEHGELSIDNNLAEQMLRVQAVGRRNWTFLGSDRGGRTAVVLYSMTGTCKHHGIEPFAYLQDILSRLPTQPVNRLGELLPDVWFEAHPHARRKKAS